jgi:hypothetical protein
MLILVGFRLWHAPEPVRRRVGWVANELVGLVDWHKLVTVEERRRVAVGSVEVDAEEGIFGEVTVITGLVVDARDRVGGSVGVQQGGGGRGAGGVC